MPTESGDMKLLGNFRNLVDFVTAETGFKPANDKIKSAALEAQYTTALSAAGDVPAKTAPHKAALNDRQSAYDALDPIVMRARNMLKASGADKSTLANAETHVRKLLGRRKSPNAKPDPKAPKDGPNTNAVEAGTNHSTSQLSFDNKVGNLDALIEVVAGVPDY